MLINKEKNYEYQKHNNIGGDLWYADFWKPKKHETGAGKPPYMFKTDSNGNGIYETHLSELPFGKWAVLMVVLHPNGDPTDMKNMVGALSAKIPENR
jgi:hypothetical protein